MMEVSAWLFVLLILFCIALAVAWILLPFAIVGTKPILRDMRREIERTNELLQQLSSQLPAPRRVESVRRESIRALK